ncbi:MAG: hypothetical protein ACYDA2_10370 [Acidimicrobiales bacterium]
MTSSREGTVRRASGEAGMTLIEMVMVIILAPLIIGVVALAVITVTRNQTGVSTRISDSADAELIAAYFVRDVDSANLVTTDSTINAPYSSSNPQLCGTGGTVLVSLAWQGAEATYRQGANGATNLTRSFCTVNGSGTATLASTAIVGHDFPASGTAPIVPSSKATAAAGGWTSTTAVTSIGLSATAPATNFRYALSGVPRTSGGGTAGQMGIPPLILFGDNGTILTITGGNNTVTILGAADLDSTGNPVIKVNNNGNTVTGNPLGTLAGTTISAGSGNTVSTPVTITPVSDPLASLQAPAGTGTPAVCTPTINGGLTTYTCPPGYYAALPGFVANATLNFTGGTYEFGTQLHLSNSNITANFGSGQYVFDNGIAITNSGDTLTSGAGGVLFYVAGGQTTVNNPATINLSPMSTGTYAGIVYFQNHADCQQIVFPGGGVTVDSLSGIVYAHCTVQGQTTSLQFNGGGVGMKLGALLVDSITINNSSNNLTLGGQ